MRRGEVWWADLEPPSGRRPVLLLTRDPVLELRTAVTIATITRTIRGIPVEVLLGPEDGMPSTCVVNMDDINTISKSLLISQVTTLSREKLADVTRAAIFALDLRV